MDFELFFSGCAFLIVGYIIYRFLLRGVKHSLEDENGDGPTLSNYVGLWGSVILCIMGGIAFIIKSLPSHLD